MVSKASEDLPEPEGPVTTVRELRGISRLMFFRLCWRAPWMTIFWRPIILRSEARSAHAQHPQRAIAGAVQPPTLTSDPKRVKAGRAAPAPEAAQGWPGRETLRPCATLCLGRSITNQYGDKLNCWGGDPLLFAKRCTEVRPSRRSRPAPGRAQHPW